MSGPECCANPPTLNPTSGGGHIEKLGELNTYVTGSPHSKLAVLLVSDIYDKNAAAGFYVAVPDFLHGDPYEPNAGRTLQDWIKDHGMDKAFEEAKPVIQVIKSKGITAIGAAVFCWAKVVVQLEKREFIQAAVLLHPSFVTVDDIKAIEVPIAILGAEFDQISPPALLKQFEKVLTSKTEVDNGFVKIFPEVAHGWTVRYNADDESTVKCAEEAHQNTLQWFAKYFK